MKRIAIFCGSSAGASPAFARTAQELGRRLAERKIGMVYGGASVGLMGLAAQAALDGGGEVIGVIPRSLRERELAHPSLSELHVVEGMHERKALMSSLSQGVIALPGGFGTLDELFEALTWRQLGIRHLHCTLLNVDGYYDSLLAFLDRCVEQGFVRPENRRLLGVGASVDEAIDRALGAS
ncbi:MAG: TIGR00730 family Rossman fold protein [Leptospirales bacterium]|nr:TIGR00730 family Rossman fold protein [Leptospirales bacterium]